MEILQFAALILFILVVTSPAFVFKKLTLVLFREDEDAHLRVVDYWGPQVEQMLFIDDQALMERDERRIASLDRVIANADPAARQLWTIKRLELLRDIKWKRHPGGCSRSF